jgi:hypothetical protein
MTAIEAFCKPQDRRERADDFPPLWRQLLVSRVTPLGRLAAMVTGEKSNRLDLVGLEPAQIAVPDQVIRMLMVPLVADVDADVVQKGRIFEPFLFAVRQPVYGPGLIEQRRRQARDVVRMVGPVVASFGQLDDAAPAHVRIAVGLRDLLAMSCDVIEHEPFPQRQIAERDLGGAEPTEDLVEKDRAGHREIRATRLEAGDAKTLFEIEHGERLADAAQLLGGYAKIAQRRVRRTPALGCHDRSQAQDRAGSADDTVKSGLREFVEVFAQLGVDVPHELAFVARDDRIAFHEPLGQTDHAELEAAPLIHARSRAAGNLDAAAADIDGDGNLAAYGRAVGGGQVDQPRFLGAGNHARSDRGLLHNGAEEFTAVLRLAHGACRDRHRFVDAMRFGQTSELRQDLECCMHRFRRERPAIQASGPEADHFFFSVDHLEGEVSAHTHDDHVHRIRPDVDSGEAHHS